MKIAIAQIASIFLNRAACIDKAVQAIREAASGNAELIVFPEAFIAGYPVWVWRLRPGSDQAECASLHQKLVEQACTLSGNQLEPLFAAARKYKITVVCGLNERDSLGSQTTLFNTVIMISHEGQLLNRHRKLVPTNAERMIWGQGDGSGLKVCESAVGRLGALICWENYMPLARYALYAQGLEVYIAPTYDSGEIWLHSMQHIARESGCWVISANNAFRAADLAPDIRQLPGAYPDNTEWVNPGGSVVIAPGGAVVAGPWYEEQGLFYAEVDLSQITKARRSLDVAGHYARGDLFSLQMHPVSERILTTSN
jgi:nitrilase